MNEPPIKVLPPDPRLDGWPVPIGCRDDLPDWLHWYNLIRSENWRVISVNCFHRRFVKGYMGDK